MKTHKKIKLEPLRVQPVVLSPTEALDRLSKLLVLDVQNPKFATNTIPNAQRLGGDIALKDIPRNQPILLICLDGGRSLTAARQLIQRGYVSIHVLKGGVMAWRRAGHTSQLTKLPT
jgi:rhodanese-related sulfurtransferase